VHFLWQGLRQGIHLITHGDPYTLKVTWVTIRVALISTGIALVAGLPAGLALGLGRFRGRRFGLIVSNAGLGLPPVMVGLVLSLLMFPRAPLGGLHLLFTLKGVIVAQTVLALPIVVALTSAAVQTVPAGLLDQARAFGARTDQVWALALREARIGVMAATIAALGSALSEVGAVVLVGGNIEGSTQTLASAALEQVDAGHFAQGMAIGIVLLGLILVLAAVLTVLQQRGGVRSGVRVSATARLRLRAPS
jgi:tungstate transport system permease protein